MTENRNFTPLQLGEKLSAAIEGIFAVETGFIELAKFKPLKSQPEDKKNPAR